jgi:hypothetical protein
MLFRLVLCFSQADPEPLPPSTSPELISTVFLSLGGDSEASGSHYPQAWSLPVQTEARQAHQPLGFPPLPSSLSSVGIYQPHPVTPGPHALPQPPPLLDLTRSFVRPWFASAWRVSSKFFLLTALVLRASLSSIPLGVAVRPPLPVLQCHPHSARCPCPQQLVL